MAEDTNYSPEQHDSLSDNITYKWWCPRCQCDHYTPYCPIEEWERLAKSWKDRRWWCQKCLDYHYGLYDCPYEDIEYCPHCGQVIKRANEGGLE